MRKQIERPGSKLLRIMGENLIKGFRKGDRVGVWPFENTPKEWIDRSDPAFTPSIYGPPSGMIDVVGSGIMKEVKPAVNALKGIAAKMPTFSKARGKEMPGAQRFIKTEQAKRITEDLPGFSGLEDLRGVGSDDIFKTSTEIRSAFGGKKGSVGDMYRNFSPEANKYMRKQKRLTETGRTPISVNSKTGMSIDFSTKCAKKRGGVGACPYCYVDHSRHAFDLRKASKGQTHKASWMQGKLKTEHPYAGELMDMPDEVIKELNKDGGIRMFSFGDFRPGIDEKNVESVLRDAQKRGLKVKAITKEPSMINKYWDHPNMNAMNLSIDYLPREMSNAVSYTGAVNLVKGKPNVAIRGVALNEKQAWDMVNDPNIQVVTLYHGYTGKELFQIIQRQNPDLVKRVGRQKIWDEISTWQDIGYSAEFKQLRKSLQKKFPDRICCQGGRCSKDKTKCGVGIGIASLIIGVHLPRKRYGEGEGQ